MSITLPPDRSAELCRRLQDLDGTLSVRLHRGASVQPAGDVVEAEVLDRGLATVMTLADEAGLGRDASVSLTTSAPASVVSAGQMSSVVRDTSTSTWEEIELTLGRERTMTAPKVVVMGLVGVIAAAGSSQVRSTWWSVRWSSHLGSSRSSASDRSCISRLRLDTGERRASLLRLDHADRLAVDEQQVVGVAVAARHRELPNRNTSTRAEVHLLVPLHDPTSGGELLVDSTRALASGPR